MPTNNLENDGFSKREADAILATLRRLAHDRLTISEEINLKVCAVIAGRVHEKRGECAMAGRVRK